MINYEINHLSVFSGLIFLYLSTLAQTFFSELCSQIQLIYLYNSPDVRGKSIPIQQVIYRSVYFSLEHLDRRCIVSH